MDNSREVRLALERQDSATLLKYCGEDEIVLIGLNQSKLQKYVTWSRALAGRSIRRIKIKEVHGEPTLAGEEVIYEIDGTPSVVIGFPVYAAESGPRADITNLVFDLAAQTIGQRKFSDKPLLLRRWYAICDFLPEQKFVLNSMGILGLPSQSHPGTISTWDHVLESAQRFLKKKEAENRAQQ